MYALLDKSQTCEFFGGINPATLYRGIRQGGLHPVPQTPS
jgi:hypothetical protein